MLGLGGKPVRRREFITLARAQQPAKVPTVAFLGAGRLQPWPVVRPKERLKCSSGFRSSVLSSPAVPLTPVPLTPAAPLTPAPLTPAAPLTPVPLTPAVRLAPAVPPTP